MSRLNEIFGHKRDEVSTTKAGRPFETVRAGALDAKPPLDFAGALRRAGCPALIAEVKAASPSRGQLAGLNGRPFDPMELAATYAANGATAISVLTGAAKYFGGSLSNLTAVRAVLPQTPLLRKDFVFDPYQVYEAREAGADAILLIVAALDTERLAELAGLAAELGMAALIEVHTADDLDVALACGERLIGINNRNLHDFSVSLQTTIDLAPRVPADRLVVAESGIFTRSDVTRLQQGRAVNAILVGEALVTSPDIAARVRELSGRPGEIHAEPRV